MPETPTPQFNLLSVVANIERHKIASGEPWLLLMDIEYPGDGNPVIPGTTVAQTHLRFVRDINPFTFDANDGNGPQVYVPFNFDMGGYKASASGEVPSCEIKASNVMLVLQTIIEQYAGIVGANLYLYAVNTSNPSGEPDLALAFTVTSTTSTFQSVSLKCGASSPLRRLFPLFVYRPNFCIWQYNSPVLQAAAAPILAANPNADLPGIQCGYIGPLTTCDHTIDGANGCQAHGNLVRVGTFPGIDSSGGAAATTV